VLSVTLWTRLGQAARVVVIKPIPAVANPNLTRRASGDMASAMGSRAVAGMAEGAEVMATGDSEYVVGTRAPRRILRESILLMISSISQSVCLKAVSKRSQRNQNCAPIFAMLTHFVFGLKIKILKRRTQRRS
jgi:hypothetical protein